MPFLDHNMYVLLKYWTPNIFWIFGTKSVSPEILKLPVVPPFTQWNRYTHKSILSIEIILSLKNCFNWSTNANIAIFRCKTMERNGNYWTRNATCCKKITLQHLTTIQNLESCMHEAKAARSYLQAKIFPGKLFNFEI